MSIISIHIFTDVGVKDCDDELCLKFVASTAPNIKKDILVVFTGSEGISAGDALAHWIRTFEANVLESSVNATLSYSTLGDYKSKNQECDYALQISPLDGFDGSNMKVNEKYVFAGDYITPEGARPSFNRVGSDDILRKFDIEEKLVSIPSAHMVKMRFTPRLLNKFQDKEFMDNIVFTAFLLIFARMSPSHSANKFAEGLINPEIGRGANFSSVMKTGFEILGVNVETLRSLENTLNETEHCLDVNSCEVAAINYCDELVKNGVELKDREGTIKYLTDINIYLQCISDPNNLGAITNIFQNGSVFVSDFDVDSIPEVLIPAWNKFKSNSFRLIHCFNPVYDLFAGYVLFGLIKGVNRVEDEPDVFAKTICQEF